MRKAYLKFFTTYFQDFAAYPARFFPSLFGEMTTILISMFIWIAVLQQRGTIGSYDLPEFLTYLLVVGITKQIIAGYKYSQELENGVRRGELSSFLMKPLNVEWLILVKTLPKRIGVNIFPILVGSLVIASFGSYFIGPSNFIAFVISIFGAFFISYFLYMIIGMSAFWFIRVSGLSLAFRRLLQIFSGHLFPLDILPASIFGAMQYMPFQYVSFVPVSIYLNKIQGDQIIFSLAVQFSWVIFLCLFSHLLWEKGLRKYDSVGN